MLKVIKTNHSIPTYMVAVSFHFHFDQIHIDYDIPLSMPVYIFIPRYSFKIHMSSESHHNTFSHECHQSCERNTFPRFIILLGSNIFLSFFITSIHVFPPSILLEKHLSWIHNSLGSKFLGFFHYFDSCISAINPVRQTPFLGS